MQWCSKTYNNYPAPNNGIWAPFFLVTTFLDRDFALIQYIIPEYHRWESETASLNIEYLLAIPKVVTATTTMMFAIIINITIIVTAVTIAIGVVLTELASY